MEPVVVVERLRMTPNYLKQKQKKRRYNKKKNFIRPKLWYKKPVEGIPKKPRVSFTGFSNETLEKNHFEGFSSLNILESVKEATSHPLHSVDLFEKRTEVTSLSCTADHPFEHKLIVSPILRRALRVVSLFDGISTALFILLEKLDLDIEVYFSSEIDENALRLQTERWDGKLVRLGDVTKISQEVLFSMGRIDLVVGGSPCAEISLVNWRGRGLNDPESSGFLFYSFAEIKEFFERRMTHAGLPFFWLFENTCHMKKTTRNQISSRLGAKPIKVCSSQFLPVLRKRYFWGNLPSLEEMPNLKKEASDFIQLQSILRPKRQVNFKIAKTITSNVHNQFSKKKNTLPVTMDGKQCHFTITEIEQLMGWPMHYTDVNNFNFKERLNLLAKGWCVPVVESILKPLKEMFKIRQITREEEKYEEGFL